MTVLTGVVLGCACLVRQAYEEVGEHGRLDAEQTRRQAARREAQLADETRRLRAELDAQRELMAQYTEFIRAASDEVISGIEEQHDARVGRLEAEVAQSDLDKWVMNDLEH